MQNNFAKCLDFTLKYEGGFVNNPHDPGGATNMGVTQATLSSYRKKAVSVQDVKNLGLDEASEIYKILYWNHINGDNLPSGVDLAVFDFAVNSGNSRAAHTLQNIIGVTADGQIGPATISAVNSYSATNLAQSICDKRKEFLQSLSTFSVFGRGWIPRVNACASTAIQMEG